MFDNLEDLKSWRLRGLSAECGREIERGFIYGNHTFDCGVTDQLNYNSMLNLANPDDSNTVQCDATETVSGDRVTLDLNHSDIKAIGEHAAVHIYHLRERLKLAKAAVNNAGTIEQVNAVVF